MMKRKDLKYLLSKGKAIIGTWCVMPSASVVNVIAATGLDFVIIDMEHGPHSFQTVEEMVRAAEVENCAALVRVAKNDQTLILNALDVGAQGVVIPHIESKADAESAVSFVKYPPLGTRGFSPFTRAGGYSFRNINNHSKLQNRRTMVILMLEGKGGIANIDDILSLENIREKIDAIYIGAYDLSAAIGVPGKVDHPQVKRYLKMCIRKIRAKGIAAGGYVAKDGTDMGWMCDMGMRFITLLPDCTVLFGAYESLYRAFARVLASRKKRRK
ncbi:HpcH/HpaI aldolase/citrate lyase family protein [Candidatus Omnitrophota bacterium]